jgi:hypothetical protein
MSTAVSISDDVLKEIKRLGRRVGRSREIIRAALSEPGTDSFDIANGRIRAIHVVRNPDNLRGFLEHSR